MIMAGMRRFAATRIRHWNASIVAGLAFVASVAAAQCGLPAVDEMPPALPGALPWKFRAAAIAMQAVPWAVIGLLFGYLAARSGIPGRRDASVGFRLGSYFDDGQPHGGCLPRARSRRPSPRLRKRVTRH
nr:CbtA family protein [Burkholderia pseudomallei]